jgi:hypothetical protein
MNLPARSTLDIRQMTVDYPLDAEISENRLSVLFTGTILDFIDGQPEIVGTQHVFATGYIPRLTPYAQYMDRAE